MVDTGTRRGGANMLEQPEFGQRLRALRVAQGLSQAQLSGSGVSTTYLSRLESGHRRPTARAVDHLVARLGVDRAAFAPARSQTLAVALARISSGETEAAVADLERAVRLDEDADPALHWQAHWRLARNRAAQGHLDEQMQHLRSMVRLSDEVGVAELRCRSRQQLARCHRSLGDIPAAYAAATDALAIAVDHDLAVYDQAQALLVLISAETELGRLPDARARADRLEALVAEMTGPTRAESLWTSSTVAVRQGDHVRAARKLDEALAALRNTDNLVLWLRLHLAAASTYLHMTPQRLDDAARRLDDAQPVVEIVGLALHAQEYRFLRALLSFHRNDLAAARANVEALQADDSHLTYRDRVRLELLHQRLELIDGDRPAAIQHLRRLATQAQDAGNIDLAADIWRTVADALSG